MSHSPLLLIAVAPNTDADRENLDKGIQRLREEDPAFSANTDRQTGHIIIGGSGELHLETIIDRLKREFSVQATVGRPHVAYKETITEPADGEMKYSKQTECRGQYAHVKLRVFPAVGHRGGCVFTNELVPGMIPDQFINAIDEGIQEASTRGVLAGHPVHNVRIELYDGSYHEVDSSQMAFKIAASMAFQAAVRKAGAVLLEPIMRVQVTVSHEYLRDVRRNLVHRRAQIQSEEETGGTRLILALVPLSEMFGYATDLQSRTRGRATFTQEFDSYQPVRIDPDVSDDDRSSRVGSPLTPIIQPRDSAIALPEPDDPDR